MIWLDEYERKARLVPGLLVLLPIPILIMALGLRQQPVIAGITGLLAAAGLPVVLTSTVRARGLMLQDELYTKWGGAPTTECLRHRGSIEDAAHRDANRREVINLVGRSLPSAVEEEADPVGADGRYRAAVVEVIERRRGKTPLVFEENKNYGFERNLLAMRPIGIRVASCGVTVAALALVVQIVYGAGLSPLSAVIAIIAIGSLLGIWLLVPSEDRVRRVGHRYAERLFATLVDV